MLNLVIQVKNIFCDDLRNFEPKIVTPLSLKKKCTNTYKSKFFLIVSISTQGHDTFVLGKLSSYKFPSGCKIAAKSQPMTILGTSTVPVHDYPVGTKCKGLKGTSFSMRTRWNDWLIALWDLSWTFCRRRAVQAVRSAHYSRVEPDRSGLGQ
jgi:hypothetical protein